MNEPRADAPRTAQERTDRARDGLPGPSVGSGGSTPGVRTGTGGTGGTGGLLWYADVPAVRARQVLADALVAAWVLAWVLVGVAVHAAVAALVEPTRGLAAGAGATADQLERGGDGLARVPLVGEEAGAPLRDAAEAVARVQEQALQLADQVGALAVALGVLVPLTPVALVLALWLPVRLRAARRAGAALQLLRQGADPQLFALRALTTQPLRALARVSPDPAGDWRRGEETVVARLAELELRGLGVDPSRR